MGMLRRVAVDFPMMQGPVDTGMSALAAAQDAGHAHRREQDGLVARAISR
jgi:hypothetical protein